MHAYICNLAMCICCAHVSHLTEKYQMYLWCKCVLHNRRSCLCAKYMHLVLIYDHVLYSYL